MLLFLSFLLFLGCAKEVKVDTTLKGPNMSFEQVWRIVSSDPYTSLPHNRISFSKLSSAGENIIRKDAQRTLDSRADILEPFEKLAHPNGICFRGIWHIDIPNIYSGYFKKDSKAFIIARASTALSNTSSEDGTRAFGFAGKLFGTNSKESSANFFLLDDLGGTDAKYYADTTLTNEPPVSFTSEVAKNLLYAAKVAYTFNQVDQHAGIRQLYEISQLNEKSENVITPKWMKLQVSQIKRNNAVDFRDELSIDKGQKIQLDISVANKEIDKNKNWQRIGTITLEDSVVSNACDHRLHFHHPKWHNISQLRLN